MVDRRLAHDKSGNDIKVKPNVRSRSQVSRKEVLKGFASVSDFLVAEAQLKQTKQHSTNLNLILRGFTNASRIPGRHHINLKCVTLYGNENYYMVSPKSISHSP